MGYAGRWFPRFEEQPASATIEGLELLIRYRRSDGMGSKGRPAVSESFPVSEIAYNDPDEKNDLCIERESRPRCACRPEFQSA